MATDPSALIYVNGAAVGTGAATVELARDQAHEVMARTPDGRVGAACLTPGGPDLSKRRRTAFVRQTRSRPAVLHAQPSQAINTGAEMTAGEWEVGCLHPLSRRSSLLLRGRASSGWWRYADLSKYC